MGTDPAWILSATALGGAISLSTSYAMARRNERAAARAAARLLRDDLLVGVSMARIALRDEKWWTQDFSLPTRSWREGRGPLALFLSDADWRTLASAFEEMDLTNGAVRSPNADLVDILGVAERAPVKGEGARRRLEMTLTAAIDADLILTRFNRPSRLWTWAKSARGLERHSAG